MKAFIHQIPDRALEGSAIEKLSFDTICRLIPNHNLQYGEWQILCRMVHTCGDPFLVQDLAFHNHPVTAGVQAILQGAQIFVDSSMQKSGLNISHLRKANPNYNHSDIHCHISDEDVAMISKQQNKVRSLFAIRKSAPILPGAIVAIGNSPIALLELNRMILEENIRPALVIGCPVGFVHVRESKEELAQLPVPSIILRNHRGGSALSVATIHALAILASERLAPKRRILILGHGSKAPGATRGMFDVASELNIHYAPGELVICQMEGLGFLISDALKQAAEEGVSDVLIQPYFLHEGNHLREDIPQLITKAKSKYPYMRFYQGQPLGSDPRMAQVLQQRIQQSLEEMHKS